MRRLSRRKKMGSIFALVAGMGMVAGLLVPAASQASVVWSTPQYGSWQGDNLWVNGEPMMTVTSGGGVISGAFTSDYDLVRHTWPVYKCGLSTNGVENSGVYFDQSTDGGASWTPRHRMNPLKSIADGAAIAQDGANIGYVYYTQKCYGTNGVGSKPRQLFFNISTNGGTSWVLAKAKPLTSAKGRVDYPTIAMAGGVILIAWTNSNTGKVMIARSANAGSTFKISTVGSTTATYSYYGPQGYYSFPSLGFDGTKGVLNYTASNTGKVMTRTTINGGVSWSAAKVLVKSGANANGSATEASATSGRIGVTWTTKSGVYYKEFTGAWGPVNHVWTPASPYVGTQWAASGLTGAGQVGIAIPACQVAGCKINKTSHIDLLWVESSNNGTNWTSPTVLQAWNNPLQINSFPTVVWDGTSSTRYVMWNSIKGNYGAYGLYLTTGVG